LPQCLSQGPVGIAGHKGHEVASREADVEGGKIQSGNILQAPPARNPVPNLGAVEINEVQLRRFISSAGGVEVKMAQVIVAMVDAIAVHGATDGRDSPN